MLLWLSGTENTKWSPNENYARELMELFTLGAGSGYTERDVREQARALTGFDNDWKRGAGNATSASTASATTAAASAIFGKSGAFDWQDAVQPLPPPPEARAVLRRQALALLHPGRARRRHAAVARGDVPQELRRSGRSSMRSSATRRSTRARGW